MKQLILSYFDASCPSRDSLHYYPALDSTNRKAKELALQGAPHGSLVIAGSQSQGRGRLGREFCSPEGNLYFTMILRPECDPTELMHLTCWAAVAACNAVEAVIGIRPRVKWINDLVHEGKKLGGILTELVFENGIAKYAIVGVGINCLHIPQPVADMATSLSAMTGKSVSPAPVAAALAKAMMDLDYRTMPEAYKQDCLTIGQRVKRMDTGDTGTALDVTDRGALVVDMDDGSRQTIASGEVSVRGLYGYI